ncbi:hypothetical protein V6N13_024962 [Hibiscus sabdariffa]
MTTDPPNPSQFLEEEEPNKTEQADEGGSSKAQYSLADGVRQVVTGEVSVGAARGAEEISEQDNGRERLKRHRIEMAKSRVWIPDIWGQEELLKDWVDCSAFDDCLVPSGIMSARAALVEEGRRATSARLRIENRQCNVFREWPEHPASKTNYLIRDHMKQLINMMEEWSKFTENFPFCSYKLYTPVVLYCFNYVPMINDIFDLNKILKQNHKVVFHISLYHSVKLVIWRIDHNFYFYFVSFLSHWFEKRLANQSYQFRIKEERSQ